MTVKEATAEVFWTAFTGLPRAAKESFLERLFRDPSLREDLADIALAENRKREPSHLFRTYLADRRKHK